MDRTFRTLVDGGVYFEGARWHQGAHDAGRWYVSDALAGVVCAFEPSGEREDLMQVDALCSGLGWLPDGSMLVVSMTDRTLLRRTPQGDVSTYADLSDLAPYWINDMWVDDHGRAWVGTIGFALHEGGAPEPGDLFRVDPDGTVVVAARDLWCPNGIVTTGGGRNLAVAESFAARITAFTIAADGTLTDRRTLAQFGVQPEPAGAQEMLAALDVVPDGMTVDAQDHIWAADAVGQRIIRVSPAGEIVDEIAHPSGTNTYTCAIGGADGHQMMIAASQGIFEALAGVAGTAELLTTTVDVPAPTA
jgi:sugar lactone lactonase YvrE